MEKIKKKITRGGQRETERKKKKNLGNWGNVKLERRTEGPFNFLGKFIEKGNGKVRNLKGGGFLESFDNFQRV